MARSIFKYSVVLSSNPQEIKLPQHARILYVANQQERMYFWAEVDTDNTPEARLFVIHGTGELDCPEPNETYHGTALFRGGAFVFHLYERM